jgi:hypothetical protein
MSGWRGYSTYSPYYFGKNRDLDAAIAAHSEYTGINLDAIRKKKGFIIDSNDKYD